MDASDSDNTAALPGRRMFGRERPIHDVLGGGKVANILLWRDTRVSAAILIGVAAVWFLFEVVEYNLITFLCHISITTMLIIFIWSSAAEFLNWDPPNIPKIILQDSTLRDFAAMFHKRFNKFLANFVYVAIGNDPKLFFLSIVSLWIISVIAGFVSSLNLLFFGILCVETLPFLYEKYEDEVDKFAHKLTRKAKKMHNKFGAEFLGKIPKGQIKDKKY